MGMNNYGFGDPVGGDDDPVPDSEKASDFADLFNPLSDRENDDEN